MLRFNVYKDGAPAKNVDLSGAYVFGQDEIPIRADLAAGNGQITCVKRVPGACGMALRWDAGPAGCFLLSTTRLPERSSPYNLNVELARGQVGRIARKVEDWGLFDYAGAEDIVRQFGEVRRQFVASLKEPQPEQAARLADEALAQGVTLGERMSLFHAEVLLKRRRLGGTWRPLFGCRVDLFSAGEDYTTRLREVVDFLSIPVPWKYCEPEEHNYKYGQVDSWVNWAARNRKEVHAGPLLSFDTDQLPEWLYIWEHEYEALRDLIYEHIQGIVKRYARQVRVWHVVSGIHAHNNFNLTFDQLMELTRMSCLLVKKLVPHAQVLIDLVMPWGEYYARNQRTIPPLLYADMAVQSGIKFDAFGVQTYMGAPVDGHYVRDLLQVSSLLDEFVSLGKTVHITGCQVPSGIEPDPWDAWGGQHAPPDAGQWHAQWSPRLQAEWLQAFSRVAVSKPYVESLCWRDLADYEGHYMPHGGLCRNDMEAKLSYKELCLFRAYMAGVSARAAQETNAGGEAGK